MTTRKNYQADYFQKNKDEILAKRRLKRQREREAGQSQLFGSNAQEESAAVPAKFEQQTINQSAEQKIDNESISNVRELYPLKAEVYGDCGYAMAGGWTEGLAEFGASPSRTTRANISSNYHQIASPNIEREVVDPERVDQPGPKPVDSEPVDPESRPTVDYKPVDLNNSKLSVKGEGRRPLSHFIISAGILALLGANTFFLVAEQLSLYESLGYGYRMALLISVLTESLLISLSLLTSWTSSWLWKPLLLTGCVLTCFVVVNILDSSVQNRVSVAAEQTGKAERLKKRIASLEKLEGTALAIIAKYDPDIYPTRVSGLMAKLEAQGPDGYSRRLREANAELDKISAAGSGHAEVLLWQRRVAMLCNLILSGFLGFLWSSKSKTGLMSRVGQALVGYFRKPVVC